MVRSITQYRGVLAVAITVLALADGILHLSLDFVLFRGNLFGRLGPPPGAPAPPPGAGGPPSFLLPLNQMFVMNLVGYVILILLLWFVAPRLGTLAWVVDALFIVYVGVVFFAWLRFGAPNPNGLGYLSKTIEVVLVLLLLVRLWTNLRMPTYAAEARAPRATT